MTKVPPNIESVGIHPSVGDLCEIAFRRSACCHGLDPKATLIEFAFTPEEADLFVSGSLLPLDCIDCINIVPVVGRKNPEVVYWIMQKKDEGYCVSAFGYDQFNDLLLRTNELRFHFNLDRSTGFQH